MDKIRKKGFRGLIWALLLALLVAVAIDAVAVIFFRPLPRLPWLIGAGLLFVLFSLLPVSRQGLRGEFGALLLVLLLTLALSRGLLFFLAKTGAYPAKDWGKTELYARQRVLVVVPEEGDELRLAAGLLEGYTRYGSALALAYTADGGDGLIAAGLGIPASNVFAPDALAEAITAFKPTLILAAKDEQAALKAALAEADKASPQVLYGLLWPETPDFYAENLLSSQDPGWYARAGLNWESRVRIPVETTTLSHAISGCTDYALLRSIGLEDEAAWIIGGDRVFWDFDAGKPLNYVKLTNLNGDFVYDYYIDRRGRESFPLYTVGKADQPYSVTVEGDHCAAKIMQGRVLEVSCPKGRSCLVTVTSADGKYSDTVRISNSGRFFRETGQTIERFLLRAWETTLPQMNTVAFVNTLRGFVNTL